MEIQGSFAGIHINLTGMYSAGVVSRAALRKDVRSENEFEFEHGSTLEGSPNGVEFEFKGGVVGLCTPVCVCVRVCTCVYVCV